MKYSKENLIDLTKEEVIAKMKDPNNFKHWQKGFISYGQITGNLGEENSRSKLKCKIGKT